MRKIVVLRNKVKKTRVSFFQRKSEMLYERRQMNLGSGRLFLGR